MMKTFKALAIPFAAAVLISVFANVLAQAADWSVKLTFKAGSSSDLLPVTLGESATGREILKPPPMPGKTVTLDPSDAIVNAYVKKSNGRKLAESIELPVANVPGHIWPIEIKAEQNSTQVTVTTASTNVPSNYNVFLFDPETGVKTALAKTSTSETTVFTTGADGSTKTIYAIVGSAGTFLVGKGDGSALGSVSRSTLAADAPASALSGISISFDDSVKATTGDNGVFTIPAVSAGTYIVKVDGPYMISSRGTLIVAADGTGSLLVNDPYAADLNQDDQINMADFSALKMCFGFDPTKPISNYPNCQDPVRQNAANLNKSADGLVNMADFNVLKFGFKKCEIGPDCLTGGF